MKPPPSSLEPLRDAIDDIDLAILRLLEQRLAIAEQIAQVKEEQSEKLPLTDLQREQQIIERLQTATKDELLREEIPALYQHLMEMSKRIRLRLRQITPLPPQD
ncbi:MAG: chorismate mutase [Myxococcales bacterium]|nr:chorismate mutase [Myxococcales bacterium]